MSQFGHHVPNEQKVQALRRGQKNTSNPNVIVYEICLQLGEHSRVLQNPIASRMFDHVYFLFIYLFIYYFQVYDIATAPYT